MRSARRRGMDTAQVNSGPWVWLVKQEHKKGNDVSTCSSRAFRRMEGMCIAKNWSYAERAPEDHDRLADLECVTPASQEDLRSDSSWKRKDMWQEL